MRNHIRITAATLGLLALAVFGTSCSDMQSSGSHEMGPPGKSRSMSDEAMPTKSN